MWSADERGTNVNCGFDGLALVDEAEASYDSVRDSGNVVVPDLLEHRRTQSCSFK